VAISETIPCEFFADAEEHKTQSICANETISFSTLFSNTQARDTNAKSKEK